MRINAISHQAHLLRPTPDLYRTALSVTGHQQDPVCNLREAHHLWEHGFFISRRIFRMQKRRPSVSPKWKKQAWLGLTNWCICAVA